MALPRRVAAEQVEVFGAGRAGGAGETVSRWVVDLGDLDVQRQDLLSERLGAICATGASPGTVMGWPVAASTARLASVGRFGSCKAPFTCEPVTASPVRVATRRRPVEVAIVVPLLPSSHHRRDRE